MSLMRRTRRRVGGRVHLLVHCGDRMYELLTGCARDMNGDTSGYGFWLREHNRLYPDETAAEDAGLRMVGRLVAAPEPGPAYRQAVLPLPWECLWFLTA